MGVQRSFIRRWPIASPIACVVSLSLLAITATIASAAHSKARSIEPIDASFEIGASGTIEASIDPPIEGVLRIIVQARESAGQHQQRGSAGASSSQNDRQPPTLEVTQWDRPIPFRFVSQSGHHSLFGSRPALLVADIDVNDLTPGVPVHVRVHSNLPASSNSAPPDLEGHAFAIVY
ncbi:MAG: hypothetical protein WDM87_01240 [Terracidiphilus sp.]